MKTYTTKQGQAWDDIALEVYGDEIYAGYLMEKNYPLLDIMIFSAGTVVNTPDLPKEDMSDAPPWLIGSDSGTDPYA